MRTGEDKEMELLAALNSHEGRLRSVTGTWSWCRARVAQATEPRPWGIVAGMVAEGTRRWAEFLLFAN